MFEILNHTEKRIFTYKLNDFVDATAGDALRAGLNALGVSPKIREQIVSHATSVVCVGVLAYRGKRFNAPDVARGIFVAELTRHTQNYISNHKRQLEKFFPDHDSHAQLTNFVATEMIALVNAQIPYSKTRI